MAISHNHPCQLIPPKILLVALVISTQGLEVFSLNLWWICDEFPFESAGLYELGLGWVAFDALEFDEVGECVLWESGELAIDVG